jgi:Na+/proline symporter
MEFLILLYVLLGMIFVGILAYYEEKDLSEFDLGSLIFSSILVIMIWPIMAPLFIGDQMKKRKKKKDDVGTK